MPEVLVVNASPVIVLSKAGFLDVLGAGDAELRVPAAVVAEIVAAPPGDPARRALEGGWGTRVTPADIPGSILEWGLGAGETAVLAVCVECAGATAVLDDAEGRACARALRLPVIGTLGLVLRAKRRGLIASAASVLRAVRTAGLYLDDSLVRDALARGAGEAWE